VGCDQRQDQPGDDQDVCGEEPRDEDLSRELAAEEEERGVAADHGDGPRDPLCDTQAVAREHVVREGVAGEAGDQAEHHEGEADQPVHFPGLPECPREEDAHHVDHDRRHEDEGGPVVDLAHQEAAADLEGQVQRRGERLRHLDALHRYREGVLRVGDEGHRRYEEHREERSGEQQDDEAPEGHLPEFERPVVREDLPGELLHRLGSADAGIEEVASCARGASDRRGAHFRRSQKLGPTGSVKSLWAMR